MWKQLWIHQHCPLGWSEKHLFWEVQSVNVSKIALWYQDTVYEIWARPVRCKDPRNIVEVLKCYRGPFFQFSLILGSKRCARMRGFQIWSQKWNRTISNPLFGQKRTVEIWQTWLFCQFLSVFSSFLAKRGIKCHPISILRPDLESPLLAHLSDAKIKENRKFYFLAPL